MRPGLDAHDPLLATFLVWVYVSHACKYRLPRQVLTTGAGWRLILYGNAIGFLFALAVLCTTVIAFPLLLDRDAGVAVAVYTSMKAVAVNPVEMVLWGLIVAVLLAIGFALAFAGLAVVIPVLGHATWHLYRKIVAPEPGMQRGSAGRP